MGFIMHNCRKYNALQYGLLLVFCGVQTSYAGGRFVKIEQTKLLLTEAKATLIADLDFQLSTSVKEALHSGIALYWDVSITLKQKQWGGMWQKTLLAQSYRYSLSYYTLLDNYRLKDEREQVFKRLSNLSEALIYMRHIEYADMAMQGYSAEQCVTGVFQVAFDREMLPAPLRPVAYFDTQWDLSASERLRCD